MTKARIARAIVLLGALGAAVPVIAQGTEPVRLITVEEARLPPPIEVAGRERNMTRGPGVDRLSPPAIGIDGPFRLAVKFKPRNGVPVDPASVRITYLRQVPVDLTSRLKAFVTAAGIDAPAVLVPAGKHVIEIEVTDKEGRPGRGQITLTVDATR